MQNSACVRAFLCSDVNVFFPSPLSFSRFFCLRRSWRRCDLPAPTSVIGDAIENSVGATVDMSCSSLGLSSSLRNASANYASPRNSPLIFAGGVAVIIDVSPRPPERRAGTPCPCRRTAAEAAARLPGAMHSRAGTRVLSSASARAPRSRPRAQQQGLGPPATIMPTSARYLFFVSTSRP